MVTGKSERTDLDDYVLDWAEVDACRCWRGQAVSVTESGQGTPGFCRRVLTRSIYSKPQFDEVTTDG